MSILLIRHGETEFNAARVVQFPETPLGANGVQQAERLGARLAQSPIELVLSSDYLRARMTAERIAAHTKARLLETPLLRERNFGEHRGKAYDTFGGLDIFAPGYDPPGGESWEVFDARVDRAWDLVLEHAAKLTGELAIVTHGLVLRSLLARRLDASAHDLGEEIVVANTSITQVDKAPPWRVATLACVAHLEDVVVGAPA